MPRAKTVRRRMLPPANRSKKPKIDPELALKNSSQRCRLMPGRGDVAAQAVDRQQTQREQHPLAQVRYPEDVRERFEELVHGTLRFPALLGSQRRSPAPFRRPPGSSPGPTWKTWCASTVILRVNSPVPRIFRPSPSLWITPSSSRLSGVERVAFQLLQPPEIDDGDTAS